MRLWFDTEFIEDGITIDLISIGAVREDGAKFYAENSNCRRDHASDWVRENVLPKLSSGQSLLTRSEIAERFLAFAKGNPRLPAQDPKSEHGALADALWTKAAWEFLQGL